MLDAVTPARAFPDLPNREAAAHLLDGIDPSVVPAPTGYHVLVLQYRRPEKTGSIILPAQAHKEDDYQGVVGYVLALGPDAYQGGKFTSGAWVKPGDWVAWPRLKATAVRFAVKAANGRDSVVLAVLDDDAFVAVGVDPEGLSV